MVLISARAQSQIDVLARHYDSLDREQATSRMTAAVAEAVRRIEDRVGPFWRAPRPYPGATQGGWQWLKSHRYWVAFEAIPGGHVVTAVFHDTADIPSRL